MASIDQLQIDIVAQDKASATLNDLSHSIENLGNALERLDAGKMTSFAKAVDKLTGIGANTNVTAKGIKTFANEISKAFDIRSKKGIDDIRTSLQALYEVHKQAEQGMDVGNMYTNAQKGIQQAIESNYKYKESMDSTTRAVKEYVEATNKSGTKVGMADMMQEFGENFKEMSSVLGGAFKNNLSSAQEGVMDLAEYLSEMNAQLGTQFDTQNVEKGFADLVSMMRNAKDVILDFKEASQRGLISEDDTFGAVLDVTDKIAALYKEQEKYNATNGLGGIVSVLSQLSNIQVPDLSPFISATQEVSKNAPQMQTVSKGVSDIGQAANEATTKVEALNEVLRQSKTVIEGNEIKEYGFTMKDAPQPQNVQYPPMVIEQAQAFEEKLLPAVIDTENEISNLYRRMMGMSSVEAVYDAVTKKFVEWKTQLMEMNGAIGGDKWNVPEGSGGFEKYKSATEQINKAISDVGASAPESFGKVEQGAQEATSEIQKAIEAARTLKKVLSDMESGEVPFDVGAYDNAVKGLEKASNTIKKYKDDLLGAKEPSTKESSFNINDRLTNIVELGDALEKVGQKFNAIGDKLTGLFKTLTMPFKAFANEYIEKFKAMGDRVEEFQKHFQAHMAKVSAFWKRTMKTFTFMIVRKVFTAIIKEVGNAVQSLAKYSNAMGTAFNTDISNMVADFQYLGRSIVSVFAPLLNVIAPIIDAIVSKIATLLSYIGMLFSFLGGKSTFTKAKKDVNNYAAGLDKASKSAKNLTMGIDELNILAENKSGGGDSGNPLAEWEDVEIPQWIKDLGKWLKDLFSKFFDPLKEAWDRAKQYVIDGFNTMVLSLKRLMGDIGRDFFEMWAQEKTIHMFEQIFKMAGDLFRVVRNLADGFDEAWNKARVGLKIFENLRDIAYNLVEHIRNVTYYMIGWAEKIDFSPLLETFEKLTSSLTRVAEFIGGVFEDIMIDGVLKYVQFMIEEGVPHLQHTLAEVFDAFSFTEIRKNLKKVWSAFEEMFENIHIGATNAIGNLGKMVARFTKSKEFTDFLQRVVDITKLITKERVEKVLTGLGKGILSLAQAVIKFVNSKPFMAFLEAIAKWIDNSSVDEIAGVLEKIAGAILLFKFGGFAAEKLSGLFQFFTVITALKNLGTIATELTNLGTALSSTGEGAAALGTAGESVTGLSGALGGLLPVIGSVVTAFLEFKGVSDSVEKLTLILDGGEGSLGMTIAGLVAKVGAAAGAFTLLLGFPAGIIAAGAVGAVAAIKGIGDAIQQINFDDVTNAIITQGDTTVAQVRSWYEDTTAVVVENCQIWKNTERDLVQGRDDIDAYARSIDGLQSAFSSNVQATVGMGNQLIGIYGDMGKSITHYIDESTNAMVNNLLSQRSYLESTGHDVDDMIAQLLTGADKQKETVNTALDNMNKAQEAYSKAVEKYGEGSKEAEKAYEDLKKVINENSATFEQYQSKVNEVDTSAAVEQITALGNSLDLSQYDYEGGWEDAANAIATNVQDIKNTTESGLQEINETYQQKIDELNDYREKNPFMSEEYYKVEMDAIVSQWATDRETLISAAEQSLDMYDTALATKLESVAASAEAKWDSTNPITRFFTMGNDKDAWIYSQMQTYVNQHLGETGLTKILAEAYEALPDHVNPSATAAMSRLVNDSAQAYQQATYGIEDYTTQAVAGSYQNVINAIPNLVEYDSSNQAFIDRQMSAAKLAAEGAHYDEISGVLVDKTGNALIEKSTDLEAYNRMLAGNGVMAMSDEYKTQLSEQAELFEAVKTFGQDIPQGVVEGINEEVEKGEVLKSVESIFKPIPQFIHDLPFFPFGSPNLKMKEYGKDTVLGYNEGITTNAPTTKQAIAAWFTVINLEIQSRLAFVKEQFNTLMSGIFSGQDFDVETPIATLFTNVTTTLTNKMNELGAYLIGTLMPNFITTFLTPAFDTFIVWFDEVAMTTWWDEHLLPWFETEKWDEEIYTPVEENMQTHYNTFIEWWDKSIQDWWNNHLIKPWFTKEKWDKDVFNPLKKNIQEHWKKFKEWWDESIKDWWDNHLMPWINDWNTLIDDTCGDLEILTERTWQFVKETIIENINTAKEAVVDACTEMRNQIQSVISAIDALLEKAGRAIAMGIPLDVAFRAEGGWVSQGQLFIANEQGPELIGTIGGRTAVASNNEITGIADAVYETGSQESQLLGTLISVSRQILDKEQIVIGDREIARMANNGQNQLGMTIIS